MEPGIPDEIVLERSQQGEAILITADKDFGELVFRLRRISTGIVLIRLAGLKSLRKVEAVVASIKTHAHKLSGALTVITAAGIRIRRHEVLQ
jgi:predicted nuclease of predicted toxin-antitoxin system